MFSAKFEYPILLNEACYIYYLTREAVQRLLLNVFLFCQSMVNPIDN